MKSIVLDVPHVQQPEGTTWCGATCLSMIYSYFGVQVLQEEIWKCVRAFDPLTKRPNCHTYLMVQDAQKRGFKAIGISVESQLDLLPICLAERVIPIALWRTKANDLYGHYCVITGLDYKGIHMNDPLMQESKGKKPCYPIKRFRLIDKGVWGSNYIQYSYIGCTIRRSNTKLVFFSRS